jgi:hypothetical protein
MEKAKQTLRAYNLEAAKAVFNYLQKEKELRSHEVNEIICAERGWDPYHITLSWNFNTIKQFLNDHGLAKKVVVNTNHVKFVATEKTLNARSFESAIAETPAERVEAFKQRYAERRISINDGVVTPAPNFGKPETFTQLGAQVFNSQPTATSPEVRLRGLKLDDKVAYRKVNTNESGVGYVSMVQLYSKTYANKDSLHISIEGASIPTTYFPKEDKFYHDGTGSEIEIIKI